MSPDLRVDVVDDETGTRDHLPGRAAHQQLHHRARNAEHLLELYDKAVLLGDPIGDIIVLDLNMPTRLLTPVAEPLAGPNPAQGTAAVRTVRAAADRAADLLGRCRPPILLYTSDMRVPRMMSCLGAGAAGLVHKHAEQELSEAIDVVANGGGWLTPHIAHAFDRLQHQGAIALTPRQLEVLALRASGFTRNRIARTLDISLKTLDKHIATIRETQGEFLAEHSETDLANLLGIRIEDLLG